MRPCHRHGLICIVGAALLTALGVVRAQGGYALDWPSAAQLFALHHHNPVVQGVMMYNQKN